MRDERRASLVKRCKYVSTIIVVQAACLGVGLWMQHQFLRSSAREAALDAAWTGLTSDGVRMAARLRNGSQNARDDDVDSRFAKLTAGETVPDGQRETVLLVDAQRRVVAGLPGRQANPGGIQYGDHIDWTPAGEAENDAKATSRGLVTIRENQYIAVTVPVGRSGRQVMILRLTAPIVSSADTILAPLPVVSGLTFVWTCALLGVAAYMVFSRFHDDAERLRIRSNAESLRQRQNLVRTRDAVVFGLAKLADSRDPETGDHLERMSLYTAMLASALRHHPHYASEVTPSFIRLIEISSVLHDIGKVGIEDRILLKKGPLTAQERRTMQTHTVIGGECLQGIERRLGNSNFLQMAREIALTHHEKWDGTGYPKGLRGEQIPLSARIVAIADVYDALSSRRVYKQALPHRQCMEIIRGSFGTHFDPNLLDVWLAVAPRFAEVAMRYSAQEPSGSNENHCVTAPTNPPEVIGNDRVTRSTGGEPVFAGAISSPGAAASEAVQADEGFDESC